VPTLGTKALQALPNAPPMTTTSPTPHTALPIPHPGSNRLGLPPEAHRRHTLLKTSALHAAILGSKTFSSIATDEHGVVQIFNAGAERMLGYAAAEVIDRMTPADLSDAGEVQQRARALSQEAGVDIAPGFEALVFKASRGIEDNYELTYRCKDGRRLPALVSVTALRDGEGTLVGYLLISTDNTARKKSEADRDGLEQSLRDINLQLHEAKRLAERASQAKSHFLSSMSHELRSPLNAILGFAQLMESGTPLPTPAQQSSIEQILKAGWYLLELIDEVLDLGLIESGKLSLSIEPVSLGDLLADCEAMMEPQARRAGITVGFEAPDERLHVQADRTRVKQVLVNLLSNAIKYNRVGGRVEVRSRRSPSGRRVRVSVQDTGEGLSADKLAQLAEPFNRLGREGGAEQGTGIGLVVCKRLLALMGGEFGVESTVGVGSVFWFELPASAPPAVMPGSVLPAPPLPPASATLASMRTVLCVEDNPANLMLVAQLLARRPDIRLLSARDGRRGIEMAQASRPDVILMDINLPGISGTAALRLLASDPATHDIPVIALSANAMPRDIERGLEAGFFRYLTKPIKVGPFMDTLDLALHAAAARASHRKAADTPP
jgi:signal transduction histidine kinase/CheY-like chemotaxis protein